jgi:hypothetical protein
MFCFRAAYNKVGPDTMGEMMAGTGLLCYTCTVIMRDLFQYSHSICLYMMCSRGFSRSTEQDPGATFQGNG